MKKNDFNGTIIKYTLFGVGFGFLFPICAFVFEFIKFDLPISLQSMVEIHRMNNLILMIDTAPLFLGLFAYVIGVKSARLGAINATLKHQAMSDELTSLHNRRYAKMKIQEHIAANTHGSKLAIFLLDLDKFKNINDTLGHAFGDQLLIQLAKRLTLAMSSIGTIARIGGDEFLVIINNIYNEGDLTHAKDKLLDVFTDPFIIDDRTLSIQGSIGVSIYPTHGEDVETLLQKADIAMYSAKIKNNSLCELYLESMAEELNRKVELEYYLQDCVTNNELYLLYQPILDLRFHRMVGVEALLRWENPKLGSIPPATFIPIAEENGFIHDIGKWVLYNACLQGKKWHDKNILLYVSVNISVEQLKDPRFLEHFISIIEATKFNPDFLHIEVTENISASTISNIDWLFERLHAYGVKISFDDFGTGFSSLSQLKNLNINTLKIDRTFISCLHINATNTLITATIIKLAKNLGLDIIAEGVETQEQQDFLCAEGCHHVQGFLYSKPIAASQIESYMNELNGKKVRTKSLVF